MTRTKLIRVGLVMGSRSDWPTMIAAARVLDELGVRYKEEILSAHRTPERMYDYARSAEQQGLKVIIAGAGGAAHLPGMIAAIATILPVIGVPVKTSTFTGEDSILSILQMPQGVPVATVALGNARNAGILAAQMLAISHPELRERLRTFRQQQTDGVSPKVDHTNDAKL